MTLYIASAGGSGVSTITGEVATGTSLKTLLQVATPATREIKIAQFAVSFDGSVAAEAIRVELVETDVAATVTALTPTKYDSPSGPVSLCVGGTSATGYNSSNENTPTASRVLFPIELPPTAPFVYDFVPGREPLIAVSKWLRLRVHAPASVNAYCHILWEE